MNHATIKARATLVQNVLKRLYDEHGREENVIDMLTDLRHLCDLKGWNFENCDRIARGHYAPEKEQGTVETL